jgi:AcrR family transcriptional regulator
MPRLTQTRKHLLGAMMKEAIYEAAVSVLVQHGVEGMTMNRVAAAADMAKGSLYNYFRDKRELLAFVHDRMAEPLLKAMDEKKYAGAAAIDALRDVLRDTFNYTFEHYEAMGVLMRSEAARSFGESVERSLRDAGIRFFSAMFRQGMEQGLFRPMKPELLGQLFVAAISDFIQEQIAAGQPPQVETTIDMLLSIFIDGIGNAVERKQKESNDSSSLYGVHI